MKLIKGQAQVKHIKKRMLEVFASFTQSTLPVILGELLWQLPTPFMWASNSINDLISRDNELAYDSNISSASLHGNGLMQSSFMEMIEALSSIFGHKFNDYIPVVLYPLLQKTSDINCDALKERAFHTMTTFSLLSGYTSFDNMLSVHFRYIIEIFSMELRGSFIKSKKHLRQQAVCFYSLHKVVQYLLKSLTEKRQQLDCFDKEYYSSDETQLMTLMDMVQTINVWFNTNFNMSIKSLTILMVVPLSMLQVFKLCIEYMNMLVKFRNGKPDKQALRDDYFPWTHLLLEFECIDDQEESPKDKGKFELSSGDDIDAALSTIILSRLIVTMRQVMMTNSVILSLPELKVQKESCDLLRQSLILLSTIQFHCKKVSRIDYNSILNNSTIITLMYVFISFQKVRDQISVIPF